MNIHQASKFSLVLCFLLIAVHLMAQPVQRADLTSNSFEEIDQIYKDKRQGKNSFKYENHIIGLVRLEDEVSIEAFKKLGGELLGKQSKGLFLVRFSSKIAPAQLKEKGISHLARVATAQKISPQILDLEAPSWAKKTAGTFQYSLSFHGFVKEASILSFLEGYKANILEIIDAKNKIVLVELQQEDIDAIAQDVKVAHIDYIQSPDVALALEVKKSAGAHYVNANFVGGRNLNGQGVVVGVGDGGELGDHLDFDGRTINYANGTYASYGYHPDLVSGIIAGGGHLDPDMAGYAAQATLLTEKTSRIINSSRIYYETEDMVITNNSYGSSFSCESSGEYNYTSQTLDWQMREYTDLIHCFAAGNAGSANCGDYPIGYKSILRSYASAKNVLTVGAGDYTKTIWESSSIGPVQDGRIKPEIIGLAQGAFSAGRNYDYASLGATSAATAAVSGTLALIYQRYREIHSGANPSGALAKAILCNSADDRGNPGPDYKYGFGTTNVRKAIELIESGNHTANSIRESQSKTQSIALNGDEKELKLMLYWHDKESDPYPVTRALVNDLDLEIRMPNGTLVKPYILNHAPSNVADDATRGVDTLNNIEQIVIQNPMAGNYTVIVKGTEVPFGPQDYVLVWEANTPKIVVTHPNGAESLEPNKTAIITWDASTSVSSNFKLEYSTDSGATWMLIENNIASSLNQYEWLVPNILTENVLVRVSDDNLTGESQATFSILSRPENFRVEGVCDGSLKLLWEAVTYAEAYEIYQMGADKMELIGTTINNTFSVADLNIGEEYWYAIAAKTNTGSLSKRNIAQRGTSTFDALCDWDNDASLRAISTIRIVGRAHTSSSFSTNEDINVLVKNIGTNTITDIPISYAINGNTSTETANISLDRGAEQTLTFAAKADLSQVGIYQINAWVDYPSDSHKETDTISNYMVYQLENDTVSLPHTIDFDAAIERVYSNSTIGVKGEEVLDFETESGSLLITTGSAEATASTGISGNKIVEIYPGAPNDKNEIIFTINLSEQADKDVLLQFDSRYNILSEENMDKVFVRGTDTDTWIELYTLPVSTKWTTTDYLFVSYNLWANNQDISTSFQIKFEHNENNVLSLDNINLYDAAQVLPVEMTSFTATKQGTDVLLKWETASEVNNDYFEVQVAKGTEAFQNEYYEVLGKVTGNGTTTDAQKYAFGDASRFKSGIRYYRLKQFDYDGSFEYSLIIPVRFDEVPISTRIFPNPFTENRFFIHFNESEEMELKLVVYNAFGFEVKRMEQMLPAGETTLVVELEETLPSGAYVVKAKTGRRTNSYKLMKQLW